MAYKESGSSLVSSSTVDPEETRHTLEIKL